MLSREGIKYEVLNAKQHEREAAIHAQAGRLGAVTVATNMAGRGVDIILGGNPPVSEEASQVRELGGLHVVGTERHEARRIDNQLRGRSGRQGDPGSSRFFVSLEDNLLKVFGGGRIKNLMETLQMPEDQPIEAGLVSRAIESAQSKIEGFNFDARKYVLEYDDVMNQHRKLVYQKRQEILKGISREEILEFLKRQIENIINFHTAAYESEWNRQEIFENLKSILPLWDKEKEFLDSAKSREEILEHFLKFTEDSYAAKEKEISPELMRQIEKLIMLNALDNLWMNHLEDMEHLRDSVRLRAYGQRDPLVEYKNEGQRVFKDLQANFEAQVAAVIFKVAAPKNFTPAPIEAKSASAKEPGRNDPCWCGSGKKYKHCHGK
jgi:preprotein translocase subunit SecA